MQNFAIILSFQLRISTKYAVICILKVEMREGVQNHPKNGPR